MRALAVVKVLIVDDSPSARTVLAQVLRDTPDIKLVGGASNTREARDLILAHRPDVIVLDTCLPRADSLLFLRKLRTHYPVPVIMCGDDTPADRDLAMKAVELGAIDVVTRPQGINRGPLKRWSEELILTIRAAAASRPSALPIPLPSPSRTPTFHEVGLNPNLYLVVIGASTGGNEALRLLLRNAPPDFPPVAMVQHMPEAFTAPFAGHLNLTSPLEIREAVDGDLLVPGRALLARGGRQMQIHSACEPPRIQYGTTSPVNRHCPSVDVLFNSALRITRRKLIGVILTGMGADGAQGLLRLRQAGALTIGQDQASCVIYGMPKVAFELGAVQIQCPPNDVPRTIIRALCGKIPLRQSSLAR